MYLFMMTEVCMIKAAMFFWRLGSSSVALCEYFEETDSG